MAAAMSPKALVYGYVIKGTTYVERHRLLSKFEDELREEKPLYIFITCRDSVSSNESYKLEDIMMVAMTDFSMFRHCLKVANSKMNAQALKCFLRSTEPAKDKEIVIAYYVEHNDISVVGAENVSYEEWNRIGKKYEEDN